MDRAPVGHNAAGKAPLLPQDPLQQLPIGGDKVAIDFIVGVHHASGSRTDGRFKGTAICLMQRLLIYKLSGKVAQVVPEKVCGCKVLHCGDNAVFLYPLDLCRAHPGAKIAVF